MKWFAKNSVVGMMIALVAMFSIACTPAAASSGTELTMYVGAETADCVGVAPQQCLLVKFAPDAEWEYLYDGIAGFDYEPGAEYELRVHQIEVANPPADGSSIIYELIEVVNVTPVVVEDPLAGTSWVLASYGSQAAPQSPLPVAPVTLTFMPGGELGGIAGCNSYFGSYAVLANGGLAISQLGMTEMACLEDGLMAQESEFLQALTTADSFRLVGEQLEIVYADGALVFWPEIPEAPQSLTGIVWQLSTLVTGNVAQSIVNGTEITAEFDGEKVAGSAGCNRYFGGYTLDGDRLTFGALGSTMMACEEPILGQEMIFLQMLGASEALTIEGDQLTLTHGDGMLIFTAVSE